MIQGWMVKHLALKSNELLVYALIYGFSCDGTSEFMGSINYICSWLNCSRPTAMSALNSLVEKELIIKNEMHVNGVKFNKYKANMLKIEKTLWGVKKLYGGGKETLRGGGKETLHNNTNNNNTNDIIENTPPFNFKKYFLDLGVNDQLIKDWMAARKKKRATNSKSAAEGFVSKCNKYGIEVKDAVGVCAEKSWSGFNEGIIKELKNGKKEKAVIGRATEHVIRSNATGWDL